MANEIVKIHNDLTNEKLGKMNAKELDLFMCICHKMRDRGTDKVLISFNDLRKLGNYNKRSNVELKKELVKANSRMLEFQIIIDIGDDTVQRSLFKEFRTNAVDGHLLVEMWEETAYILNDIASHFTRFELSEFVSLESKYAKRLYKLLKQYRMQGTFYISKDDFYKALDVPSTYTNTNYQKKVLKPALEECRKYIPSLECVPKKFGRGGAVKGYTFTFSVEVLPSNKKSKNKFNEFEQRRLNFDELESQILSN